MNKGRLEAFSDGVLAIIITIMVLELKVPHGSDLASLRPLVPTFLAYVVSFVYVGIYWNNHHHLIHATRKVDGRVMWANLHLLFWLSLVPFVSGWVGEHPEAPAAAASYGVALLMAALAWFVLVRAIVAEEGPESTVARAIGTEAKGMLSGALYVVAIGLAFVHVAFAYAIYAGIACLWVVPDRRIAARVHDA